VDSFGDFIKSLIEVLDGEGFPKPPALISAGALADSSSSEMSSRY
jgi:hypothetical protein